MSDLAEQARRINVEMEKAFPKIYKEHPLQPTVLLCEEAGEFAGAIRRVMGLARRTGTLEEAAEELADVVISAYVAADVYWLALDEAIERKLVRIFERGFKDSR